MITQHLRQPATATQFSGVELYKKLPEYIQTLFEKTLQKVLYLQFVFCIKDCPKWEILTQ